MGIIRLLASLILLFSPGTTVGVITLFVALGFIRRRGAVGTAMRRSDLRASPDLGDGHDHRWSTRCAERPGPLVLECYAPRGGRGERNS